jgi:hypothetical protein
MKPAWDALSQEFEGSKTVLVADVDCTTSGKSLCARFKVSGFPTIKYFNPPNHVGEDYDGGRSLDQLRAFAESELKIACSPTSKSSCLKEELAQLEKDLAIPAAARTAELVKIYEAMDADAEKHDAYLEELQAKYEEAEEAIEARNAAVEPRVKQLKAAGTTLPEGFKRRDEEDEDEEDEEDEEDDDDDDEGDDDEGDDDEGDADGDDDDDDAGSDEL